MESFASYKLFIDSHYFFLILFFAINQLMKMPVSVAQNTKRQQQQKQTNKCQGRYVGLY